MIVHVEDQVMVEGSNDSLNKTLLVVTYDDHVSNVFESVKYMYESYFDDTDKWLISGLYYSTLIP